MEPNDPKPIKSLDKLNLPRSTSNDSNPNPYLRRFGSHIKSHFSQSNCEIFGSSDDEGENEQSRALGVLGDPGSMSSMGSMVVKKEFNRPGNNSSLQNLDRGNLEAPGKSLYGGRSVNHLKNRPSLGGPEDLPIQTQKNPTQQWNQNQQSLNTPNHIEPQQESARIEIENNDILSPHYDNVSDESLNSVELGPETLAEPGTENILEQYGSNEDRGIEEENEVNYLKNMISEKIGDETVDTAENSFHLTKKNVENEENEGPEPLELEED